MDSAYRRVSDTCQAYHGGTFLVQRVGSALGAATVPESAVVYRERVQWRRTRDDRHQVMTRRIILDPSSATVPIGSTFTVDELTYTVESVSRSSASGSQTLQGTRSSAASLSRPGYYGDE